MIGAELRARREALGWTRYRLGKALGIHQTTIERWEAGTHPIERARVLELALEALEERAAVEHTVKRPT